MRKNKLNERLAPTLQDARERQKITGLGGRNQSVESYTTKRQKSRGVCRDHILFFY